MVHHTISSNTIRAPSASSNNHVMSREFPGKSLRQAAAACIVGSLAACATGPLPPDTATRPVAVQRAPAGPGPRPSTPASDARDHQSSPLISVADSPLWQWLDLQPLPGERAQPRSRWVPVRWGDLPGWGHDSLHEAWVAWLRS